MTYSDTGYALHMIQAALVLLSLAAIACALLASTGCGRKLLRRIAEAARRHPDRFAVAAVSLWIGTAYGGSKPPAVVTEDGIELVSVRQDPRRIEFVWTTTDEKISVGQDDFMVQELFPSGWMTIARTKGTNYVQEAFTINRTHRYRIAVDVTAKEEQQ